MGDRELEKKYQEEKVVSTFYEKVYNFSPCFIEENLDPPDCYFKHNDKTYAIEVTRYFSNDEVQQNIKYFNSVKRFIKSEDLIKNCYMRLGKDKVKNNPVIFNDIDIMKKEIITGVNYIDLIQVRNTKLLLKNIEEKKRKVYIINFLKESEKYINDHCEIKLFLKKKNKNCVSLTFKYSEILAHNQQKSMLQFFSFWENKKETCDKILNAINKKVNKFFNEYVDKMNKKNLYYDYYVLVVYYEMIVGEIDIDFFYDSFKNRFKKIGYDEIAIFISGGVLVINDNEYEFHELYN